jgi:hypothetical protein
MKNSFFGERDARRQWIVYFTARLQQIRQSLLEDMERWRRRLEERATPASEEDEAGCFNEGNSL